MPVFVVDTNVAISANGRNTHADVQCQRRCVREIRFLVKNGIVAVDDGGLLIREYSEHLSFSGSPGVGDVFFKHLLDCWCQDDLVRRVTVTRSDDDQKGFEELPENTFDPSDRKFLAVAVVANAAVLNAVDSDWSEHKTLMEDLGVNVEELCPQHILSGFA